MNFERDGKPTPEFLNSDAYYDDPAPRISRPACGPCRACGRTNERFTLWAEQKLCTGCSAAAAAEPPAAAKEAA